MFCVKPLANEDTLLPTKMFPRLPARATFVADTNFVSGTQKMFLILFRNILCPQRKFPSLRSMKTQHSFCVPRAQETSWATMCPQQCVPVCQGLKVPNIVFHGRKKKCTNARAQLLFCQSVNFLFSEGWFTL